MKNSIFFITTVIILSFMAFKNTTQNEWISLFDGKSLNNWKVGQNASTFSVDSGMIIAHGATAHLFYMGDAQNHNFKNFEFKADVMTTPGSNSGLYFHTQ